MFSNIAVVYANAIEHNTGRTLQLVPRQLRDQVTAILCGRKIIGRVLTYKQVCGLVSADDTDEAKNDPYFGKAKDNAQMQKMVKEYVTEQGHAYLVE